MVNGISGFFCYHNRAYLVGYVIIDVVEYVLQCLIAVQNIASFPYGGFIITRRNARAYPELLCFSYIIIAFFISSVYSKESISHVVFQGGFPIKAYICLTYFRTVL